jgi:hypothetical protein
VLELSAHRQERREISGAGCDRPFLCGVTGIFLYVYYEKTDLRFLDRSRKQLLQFFPPHRLSNRQQNLAT